MQLPDDKRKAIKRWAKSTSPIERVFLFGSYASGRAHERSDVDLAIQCAPASGSSLSELIANRSKWVAELEAALGAKVDLYSIDNAKAPLMKDLGRAGALIYDRTKAATVSKMATDLASGYLAVAVGHHVAIDPRAINLLPPAKSLGNDPVGEIKRKDGTSISLNLRHYLDQGRENFTLRDEFIRSWAIGALITLGDALSGADYFDRAPVLEMIYHLRNGVAHGNRFNIDDRGRKRLAGYPANTRNAAVKGNAGTTFEITAETSGPVLFDFMGGADIIDLFQSVEVHLSKLAGLWTDSI
jgi:predicted nucleotidyltransferase